MRRLDYDDFPCTFLVPVEKADFASLHGEHRELGVVTDLQAIGRFGIEDRPRGDLLHCDLQLVPWAACWYRLGSGRSGFYRGHYLKGVGKTPLAANWCRPDDWYHGTGHLFPTAAVREYLTTAYLEARGLGDHIVPCRGVLFARLAPGLRADLERALGKRWEALAPIDRSLQAISVKPADFARLSNFLWMLSTLSGWGGEWRRFAVLLEQYSKLPDSPPVKLEACTPASIGRALEGAQRRAIGFFDDYFDAGVLWNSIWNNIALDGRFLDLEVATLACRPFFGATVALELGADAAASDTSPAFLCGLEQIDCAVERHLGVTRLRDQIASLIGLPLAHDPLERRFMEEMVQSLNRVCDDAAFGKSALVDAAVKRLSKIATNDTELSALVAMYHDQRRSSYPVQRLPGSKLVRTDFEFHRTEPLVSQALWLEPDAFQSKSWEDSASINVLVEGVEACTDTDLALAKLSEAEAAIRERFSA